MNTATIPGDIERAQCCPARQGERTAAIQVVAFELDDGAYGMDVDRVQEVIMMGSITRLPNVPESVLGLFNLRGSAIPIIDLRARLGLEARPPNEHTRIIVVSVESKTVGVVVDSVTEVLRFNAEQVESTPLTNAGIDPITVRGLVKWRERLLVLLNVENLLPPVD